MTSQVEEIRVCREVEFGDPTPNAVGRNAVVSSEGCVVHLEENSAKRLMWSGEDLLDVKLPAGTRVVYPKPTIPGIPDRDEGIRYALKNPEEMDPLEALLRPGMKADVTIFDEDKIIDRAEFGDPHQYAEGVLYVIVNGETVLDDGEMTKARPGQVLYGLGKKR